MVCCVVSCGDKRPTQQWTRGAVSASVYVYFQQHFGHHKHNQRPRAEPRGEQQERWEQPCALEGDLGGVIVDPVEGQERRTLRVVRVVHITPHPRYTV